MFKKFAKEHPTYTKVTMWVVGISTAILIVDFALLAILK